MKFYFSLFAFVFFGFYSSFGQQIHKNNSAVKKHASLYPKNMVVNNGATARALTVSGRKDKCGFAQMMTRAKAKGYDEIAYEGALQKLIKNKIKNGKADFAGPVTVPIIFHCIYRTGQAPSTTKPTPNLVAAAYQAQVDQLNLDYANRSLSSYGVAADVKIQFCMAVVDTTGKLLLEPGIDRINASTRGWKDTKTIANNAETYIDTTIKPATIWDPYSYFNVWTVAMDSSGLLGYATFPSSSTLNGISAADATETDETAGVVMAWQAVGSVNRPGVDASYGYGRTLTHESGHFFGLRHIWGDATCGDDYCADTPPQDAETYGCPTTAADKKNNCIPAGPKMYQNYMDYSDDACLNTFTANQALRCQTTMDNSPRRMGLLKSKACVTRAGNSIQFGAASQLDVVETGKLGTCPSVQTYTFNIYISDKATGTATVTFSSVGGTALQNKDYTISPASITYAANDNGIKTVTVTVIDDQIVEPTETIQIGYTISGTGVVAGPEKQVVSLNIIDDDIEVGINNLTPTKTLFSENFNASTSLPLGWTTDVLDDGTGSYTPNQWVISPNGGTGTTGNAAHITRYPTTNKTNTYNNVNISDAYLFSPLIDATGVKDVNLNFLWRCLGEVGYDEGYLGYIPFGQAITAGNVIYLDNFFSGQTTASTANIPLPTELNNSKFYLVFNWYNDDLTGSNPPFTIDNVVVTGKKMAVATTIDADTTFNQFAGQSVAYYSNSTTTPVVGRIIATVYNPSQDMGCTAASVQSAGTGKTAFSTAGGSFSRANKVIKITPAVASATATYQATVYFSTAELSPTWTGTEIPTLKLLKVKDGVSLTGVINSADAQLVSPSFGDNSTAAGYYSYTGNFKGFSQFLLVSPNTVLAASLSNFTATAQTSSILLNWSTATGVNIQGFKIDKSTDGINFSPLGVLVSSTSSAAYSYDDKQVVVNTDYYYRIRIINLDNTEDTSYIKQAKIIKTTLLSFDATALKNTILLNWSTALEVNNKGFFIDRSTNGVNFSNISWVAGKVNSATTSAYSYEDVLAVANTDYYYRIRLVNSVTSAQDTSYIRQARIGKTILSSFTATAQTNSILLNWSTAIEVNNKGFYIDRSTNGVDFSNIGWMVAKINSATPSAYSYDDLLALANTNYYYRIRWVNNLDNSQDTSSIKQARITKVDLGKTNLANFTATGQTSSILLNWSTSIEVNNKGFYIDRSTNGIDFKQLTWVNGKGNSAGISTYSFADASALTDTNYFYRIRLVNSLTNAEDTSFIRQARITTSNATALSVRLTPVPAKDVLNITILGTSTLSTVHLLNGQGQLVKSWENLTSGITYTYSITGLSSGVYLLQVITPGENLTKKIMIGR